MNKKRDPRGSRFEVRFQYGQALDKEKTLRIRTRSQVLTPRTACILLLQTRSTPCVRVLSIVRCGWRYKQRPRKLPAAPAVVTRCVAIPRFPATSGAM